MTLTLGVSGSYLIVGRAGATRVGVCIASNDACSM